jgi:adenylate kinase family enzyme
MLNTIKEGRIVPSEVTVRLIQQEMESSDSNKFLIDGFPRTEENRIAFEQLVSFLFFFTTVMKDVVSHPDVCTDIQRIWLVFLSI